MEIRVRNPGGIKVDRGDIQRLFDPVGVVKQPVVGRVGDNGVNGPARPFNRCDFLFYGGVGKLPAWNAPQDA
ncbi:hypothetical protein D3C71_2164740 [compost metagenome]